MFRKKIDQYKAESLKINSNPTSMSNVIKMKPYFSRKKIKCSINNVWTTD